MAKVLIVGCGGVGLELAIQLAEAGHDVTGLKRNPPTVYPGPITYFRADISQPQELEGLESNFEYVFFIVSADSRNKDSYHALYNKGVNNLSNKFKELKNNAPWIFGSSTSVYGQSQGEWVDEDSPTLPNSTTSLEIVKAEQKLISINPKNIIVRFSGIYGPGREYLLRMAKQSPSIQQSPPYFTNRIHQQDCVGVLKFLFEQRLSGVDLEQCYLASDNDPAPLWDVISWIAEQTQSDPPKAKEVEHENDMNKRCKNDRLKKLGYTFLYPDYKAGYLEMIHSKAN
jgi:nucleoside-diphosphate-sugar epimerase